jgi:hypothetical protein
VWGPEFKPQYCQKQKKERKKGEELAEVRIRKRNRRAKYDQGTLNAYMENYKKTPHIVN